ncbi:MAG: bifunctional oligoribonuclease/PAP phosphatase NrnA [Candidatus Omnitrophota bacterium]
MLKKIVEIINKEKSFLITAHINVEGDALGSVLAVYGLLRQLKKRAVIYNNDFTPQSYSFLPYVKTIKNELNEDRFDVALVLDCSDSSRTGKVKDYLGRAGCIVNIDHHISNTFFGDMNWVDPKASSAAEMVFKLCREFKIMNKDIALCLYTGIFTDTGNFTYANTTKNVHKIVGQLMDYNILPAKIYEQLHSCCRGQDLLFIGRVVSGLKVDHRNRICWILIGKWPDMGFDLTEIIFSIMKLMKDMEVFVLFKKVENKKVRVNFRSRSKVDVNRIAKFFGGGGHKRASGTTVEDSLAATEKKVISFIKRYTDGKNKR